MDENRSDPMQAEQPVQSESGFALRGWLQTIALLAAGTAVGAGATLLVLNASSLAFERTVSIGIVAGFAAFMFFVLMRFSLVSLMKRGVSNHETYRTVVLSVLEVARLILGRTGPIDPETRDALDRAANRSTIWIREGVTLGAAYVGAAASIGLALGIVGAVISMAAVVAAHRQVERMDAQNTLIQKQIFEATATRISQLFAAQLPSLLDELQRSRSASKGREWIVGEDLLARIQALIYATQPYSVDDEAARWVATMVVARRAGLAGQPANAPTVAEPVDIRFSPERGQLLSILLAARFPFESLPRPLDFSFADLRGISLGRPVLSGPVEPSHLGETILRGANFRTTHLIGLDMARTDLAGAFLPEPAKLESVETWFPTGPPITDVRHSKWLGGANLEGALMEVPSSMRNSGSIEALVTKALSPPKRHATIVNLGRWIIEPHEGFVVFKERAGYEALIEDFHSVLGEIGGLSIDQKRCNSAALPRLERFRRSLAAMDVRGPTGQGSVRAFLWVHLAKMDTSIQECLIVSPRINVQELQK